MPFDGPVISWLNILNYYQPICSDHSTLGKKTCQVLLRRPPKKAPLHTTPNFSSVPSSTNMIARLRFDEAKMKYMDESSGITLPSPTDVFDVSFKAEDSSVITMSDFRLEYRDVIAKEKSTSSDVQCQQETPEKSSAPKDEVFTSSSPLPEPLLKNEVKTNEPRDQGSHPYLYGKQIHSKTSPHILCQLNKQDEPILLQDSSKFLNNVKPAEYSQTVSINSDTQSIN